MASELRKTILESEDIQTEIVPVPEWNGVKVEVRGMSARERSKLLKRATAGGGELDLERWFPELIIATVFDPETGDKVFEPADRDALNGKNGAAISRITDVASRLSGLSDNAVEEAKQDFCETPDSDSNSS